MGWKVREFSGNDEHNKDRASTYGIGSDLFSIKLYHSGRFILVEEEFVYVDGKMSYIDECTVDEMSMLELGHMAAEVNYVGNLQFYCSTGGVDECRSLLQLKTDSDTLNLPKFFGEDRVVGFFVVDEQVEFDNMSFETVLPEVDEPVNYMCYCQKENTESEGEMSHGEDSNNSEFYDSDGGYFDEDYKFQKDVDIEKLMATVSLQEKLKKPWLQGENEKFRAYSGDGHKLHKGFRVFNPNTDMKSVQLEREMCFTNPQVLRDACRKHAVDCGRTIHFPINKPHKIQVKCINEWCPFYLFASHLESDDKTMQIKVIHFEHDCLKGTKTKQADTRFLVKQFGERMRKNPKWEAKSMLEEVNEECSVNFSKKQMYRAKLKVKEMDCGDGRGQFQFLERYGNEILRSNRGSTVKFKVRTVGDLDYFMRMYICYGALKEGMLDGCRRVILLDGCHVRTKFGGIILTAIGVDANNSMYPFAFAVVEKETEVSWTWFLELVKRDLSITQGGEWTFMSDKQKGLVKAVTSVFQSAEHRFCVVHLYSNFKLKHKGLPLKDILWKAARATREADYERAMDEMKALDVKAYEWLCKRPPQNWSKAFFKTTSKCDLLLNNLSESFNGAIAKIRQLPILWMLESIRYKFMETIAEKRQKMLKFRGELCPRIVSIYEKNLVMSTEFTSHWNGAEEFNVSRNAFATSYKVHIGEKFCSCRRWQLTAIPCAHAICCLVKLGKDPITYIDECYSKATYLRIYNHYLMPIGSQEEWPAEKEGAKEILPPIAESQPGRPKEFKRVLQAGEVKGKIIVPSTARDDDKKFGKMPRQRGKQHCNSCKGIGHNKQTCPKNHKVPIDKRKDIPSYAGGTPTTKKKKVVSGDDNVEEPIRTNKLSKLQVRRNVDAWLSSSQGDGKSSNSQPNDGTNYSQPDIATSSSQPTGRNMTG